MIRKVKKYIRDISGSTKLFRLGYFFYGFNETGNGICHEDETKEKISLYSINNLSKLEEKGVYEIECKPRIKENHYPIIFFVIVGIFVSFPIIILLYIRFIILQFIPSRTNQEEYAIRIFKD